MAAINSMTESEVAWLAGLFDGEGCIKFSGKSSAYLVISMSDLDILEKALERTGAGNIYSSRAPSENRKPMWEWSVCQKIQVELLIKLIYPWLGSRRQKRCKEAIERLKNNPGKNITIKHGTVSGYFRERRLGLETCSACKKAQTAKSLEYLKQKKQVMI